jgi:hypothetical protein
VPIYSIVAIGFMVSGAYFIDVIGYSSIGGNYIGSY